ncbi:ATP-dependent Clp protease proteolytic subunit [Providencia rettgeri]
MFKKFILLLSFLGTPSFAADITPYINRSGEVNIQINGPIVNKDDLKFATILSEIQDRGLNLEYVTLNSPGGDVAAATNMAFAINSKKANTVIVKNGICASACFLMFVAGNERFIFQNATVGVHQISYAGQSTLITKGLSLEMSDIYDFFYVPEKISYRMLKTPPSELYQLTESDKKHFDKTNKINNRKLSVINPSMIEKNLSNQKPFDIYTLALSYYLGYGNNKDLKKALDYFQLAGDKSSPEALHKLGVMYDQGIYVKQNTAMSDKYWKEASRLGHMPSRVNLAVVNQESNPKVFFSVLNEAATSSKSDKGLIGYSYYTLGEYYLEKGQKSKAQKYFMKGASFGDYYAQYMVGYLMMLETDQMRKKLGYLWIESSCYGGYIDACRYIGK